MTNLKNYDNGKQSWNPKMIIDEALKHQKIYRKKDFQRS